MNDFSYWKWKVIHCIIHCCFCKPHIHKCSQIFHALITFVYFAQYKIVAGTSVHFHLDLFIWQTFTQSDLQRIQGLHFINTCVSANRTRVLAVSCTCSSGWVMCLERESEWLNLMSQQKRKSRSLSQASWSPYWDRGGTWPEKTVQKTRPNHFPLAAVRVISLTLSRVHHSLQQD